MYSQRMLALSAMLGVLFVIQCPSTSAANYYRVGCFKDTRLRAMPKNLGNWPNDNKLIQKCAQKAEDNGYSAFGVQHSQECWSGPLAHMTYSIYGASNGCVNGTGGTWTQDVYMFVNANRIGNYDIKRCYKVNITFHYQFPGGLTRGTVTQLKGRFTNLFTTVASYLGLVNECSGVNIKNEDVVTSPPGEESVFFRIPTVFTAPDDVADSQVSPKLTTCINYLISTYKVSLDSFTPSISQGGVTKNRYNASTITKESCCGGDIPPPCCAAGSIKVSSTKCGCMPGFRYVPNKLCIRCPSDTYQEDQGQQKCDKCPLKKQTFGKTGMTSESNCSDTNPLQLQIKAYPYLPHNIKADTVVGNVTVTGNLASLVQPLLYYLDSVTQSRQRPVPSRGRSRIKLKRRRRDNGDICEEAGTIKPLNYFCVHRLSGKIKVTQDFVFMDGEEFDLVVRVTDSDPWGKTENKVTIKMLSGDQCKEIRIFYDEASTFCSNVSSAANGKAFMCPSMNCLLPLFNWQRALNKSSEKLQEECSIDPKNLEATKRHYSSCVGPPTVTVNPVSLHVAKGAAAVLTCNASSPLHMNIAWFKNGQQIGSGSRLQIDNFQNEDQGDYVCKFSTYLTSIYSKPASLLLLQGLFYSKLCSVAQRNVKTSMFLCILYPEGIWKFPSSSVAF